MVLHDARFAQLEHTRIYIINITIKKYQIKIKNIVSIRIYSLNTFDNVIHAGTQEAAGDIEIDQLRRRLVETEAAMERIVVQMGNISRSVMHSPNPQQEFKVYQINYEAVYIFSSLVLRNMHVVVF